MRLNLRDIFMVHRVCAFLRPVAWLLVATAGAWLLSGQIWRFVLPQAAPGVERVANPVEAAATIAGRHIFGAVAPGGLPVAATAAATSYRLQGVIAASAGQPAAAVLQLQSGTSVAVGVGGEVEPGVRLSSVEARSVRLLRGNSEINLALPERDSAGR